MVEIEFYDDGVITKGILLGIYQRPYDDVYSYEKKFLWKTKTVYKHQTINTTFYLVFIPWKHQIKELREIKEEYIVDPQSIRIDEDWIKKESFISRTANKHIYQACIEVNDFVGYKFLYDNNNFIANLYLYELDDCLNTLYKNLPEFLNLCSPNTED